MDIVREYRWIEIELLVEEAYCTGSFELGSTEAE